MKTDEILERAVKLRRTIVRAICRTPGGHLGASLSIVELLAVLYNEILRIEPGCPDDPDRDRFILSKGHAAVALYSVLCEQGFLPPDVLDTFGLSGTILGGHPDMLKVPGVEASTGALGHGLPFGVGVALAGKMDKKNYRVFVLLGDGECQEGSIWEALLFAPRHGLDNLVVIIDYNKLQAMDYLEEIVPLESLSAKLKAFGWVVREIDGHDIDQISETLKDIPASVGQPTAVIAHTVKGKGISFMEGAPIWHYRLPNEEECDIICRELGMEEL